MFDVPSASHCTWDMFYSVYSPQITHAKWGILDEILHLYDEILKYERTSRAA